MIGKIWPSECLDEEKTQSSGTTFDRSWRKLAVAKQVNLVLATPTIRRLMENFALLPHRAEAHYHRALQAGWSRFRAVLMLSAFYISEKSNQIEICSSKATNRQVA